jgi:hypothetical protein
MSGKVKNKLSWRSSRISKKSRRSTSDRGAMAQSSTTRTSSRANRASKERKLPSARANPNSQNGWGARV